MILKPLVSVIVPIYNMEKYLAQSLDSLVCQTYRNLEIILVNDGSVDSSLKIAKDYECKDKRIVVVSKPNGGLSSARNCGLRHATGEYIGFLDSDDWIAHDYYEKLLSALIKNKADIAYASIVRVTNGCEKPLATHESRALTSFEEMMLYQNNGSVWSKLFKRDLIFRGTDLENLFPEGLHFEDNEFLVKAMYRAKKMVLVPETTYYYRNTPTSIVNNKKYSDKNRNDGLVIAKRIDDYFKKDKAKKEVVVRYLINAELNTSLIFADATYRHDVERILSIKFKENRLFNPVKRQIRLFGFIPVLKVVQGRKRLKYYLFGVQVFSKKVKLPEPVLQFTFTD